MTKHPKILVVDDEPRMCHSMKTLLSTKDYEVQTCFNGDDALDFLTRESFDLVLLDIFMEGMDGFQVIENKVTRKIDTPVIIMSGKSSTDTAVKALRMGAIDYLKKPFETQEMFTSVKNSLNRASLENTNKTTESQSAQRLKAESLGRMAGAIAHHFNNQLSVVMGNLEIAMEDLPADAVYRENLFQAMMAAHKAGVVSRQMLIYLGHNPGRRRHFDLPEACRQTLSLLKAATPKGMTLIIDFPDSGPMIHADPIQIQRILTLLITNAWESIFDNQGTIALSIKTVSHTDIPSRRIPIDQQLKDRPHACLKISDTGCGIAHDDIEKLFDPFFTTKFTGRGLGLSMVMGIVKAHGGSITVDSEPGFGSVFRLYLPVSAEKNPLFMKNRQHRKKKVENGGTVLLIEDEESVRNMAKTTLSLLGYKVIEARDGVEAVR